jgi:hypothetical protein
MDIKKKKKALKAFRCNWQGRDKRFICKVYKEVGIKGKSAR